MAATHNVLAGLSDASWGPATNRSFRTPVRSRPDSDAFRSFSSAAPNGIGGTWGATWFRSNTVGSSRSRDSWATRGRKQHESTRRASASFSPLFLTSPVEPRSPRSPPGHDTHLGPQRLAPTGTASPSDLPWHPGRVTWSRCRAALPSAGSMGGARAPRARAGLVSRASCTVRGATPLRPATGCPRPLARVPRTYGGSDRLRRFHRRGLLVPVARPIAEIARLDPRRTAVEEATLGLSNLGFVLHRPHWVAPVLLQRRGEVAAGPGPYRGLPQTRNESMRWR